MEFVAGVLVVALLAAALVSVKVVRESSARYFRVVDPSAAVTVIEAFAPATSPREDHQRRRRISGR